MTTDPPRRLDSTPSWFGWSDGGFGEEVLGYRIFSAGKAGTAAMIGLPGRAEQVGMRAGRFGYIGVNEIDAAVAGIATAGGKVHMPANDLPGVSRIAMVAGLRDAISSLVGKRISRGGKQ